MPIITKISEQKRAANRRNIFVDGKFAFGVNINVVARFYLREGMNLSAEKVTEIEAGEVRQECFDNAMEFLGRRMHSRSELKRKLNRKEFGESIVEGVLGELTRLGYLDDERFARTKALGAVQSKHHGQRRARLELLKSGVRPEVADRALQEVYSVTDSLAVARRLAMKQAPRLRKLEPVVARRRLVGMLQRRGFDFDTIKPLVDQVLGGNAGDVEE